MNQKQERHHGEETAKEGPEQEETGVKGFHMCVYVCLCVFNLTPNYPSVKPRYAPKSYIPGRYTFQLPQQDRESENHTHSSGFGVLIAFPGRGG